MVRTAKVAICNREGREGRGEGGCRRGIAAFEEIPTSGRNYPTANSRTVGDDDQLVSESCHSISLNSTDVQKLMSEARMMITCHTVILRKFGMSTDEDNGSPRRRALR